MKQQPKDDDNCERDRKGVKKRPEKNGKGNSSSSISITLPGEELICHLCYNTTNHEAAASSSGESGGQAPRPTAVVQPANNSTTGGTPIKCVRRNCGRSVNVKGHKKYCSSIACTCHGCALIKERRRLIAMQMAIRRARPQDEELGLPIELKDKLHMLRWPKDKPHMPRVPWPTEGGRHDNVRCLYFGNTYGYNFEWPRLL